MTTPTIFSDKAINPKVNKFMSQGMLFQKAKVLIPTGTTIATIIGVIRVQEGCVLDGFSLRSDNLGAGTLNIGFVLDNTQGENTAAYVSSSGIINSGGSFTWPSDVTGISHNVGNSPVIPGDGYISFQIDTANTTITGEIDIDCRFTYDE